MVQYSTASITYGEDRNCNSANKLCSGHSEVYIIHSARLTVLVTVLHLFLASVVVALRLKVRKSTKAGFDLDDYAVLATLVVAR